MTLDEVQREPRLLHAVQPAIDGDRTPGRFLLTGSANLLLMRQISESLAGRASYLTLWPMMRLIAYKFAPAMTRGQLLNQTEPARDVSLPQPTVHR